MTEHLWEAVFLRWVLLYDLKLSDLLRFGTAAAVYAFRDARTSEIVKFGHTGHLRDRMFKNYISGVGGGTTQRVHRKLFMEGMIERIEVSWFETVDKAEAERSEKQFRQAYRKCYGKRPSWDFVD